MISIVLPPCPASTLLHTDSVMWFSVQYAMELSSQIVKEIRNDFRRNDGTPFGPTILVICDSNPTLFLSAEL
jgi:hypothetical protein